MPSAGWSLLMLLLVLAAIPATLWLARRAQLLRGGGERQLEVLAQLPLGARERVLLVRVQQRVLVLGATAQQISVLGEAQLPPPGTPGATAAAPGFAAVLQSLAGQSGTRGQP